MVDDRLAFSIRCAAWAQALMSLPKIEVFKRDSPSQAVQNARRAAIAVVDQKYGIGEGGIADAVRREVPDPPPSTDEGTRKAMRRQQQNVQKRLAASLSRDRPHEYVAKLEEALELMERGVAQLQTQILEAKRRLSQRSLLGDPFQISPLGPPKRLPTPPLSPEQGQHFVGGGTAIRLPQPIASNQQIDEVVPASVQPREPARAQRPIPIPSDQGGLPQTSAPSVEAFLLHEDASPQPVVKTALDSYHDPAHQRSERDPFHIRLPNGVDHGLREGNLLHLPAPPQTFDGSGLPSSQLFSWDQPTNPPFDEFLNHRLSDLPSQRQSPPKRQRRT